MTTQTEYTIPITKIFGWQQAIEKLGYTKQQCAMAQLIGQRKRNLSDRVAIRFLLADGFTREEINQAIDTIYKASVDLFGCHKMINGKTPDNKCRFDLLARKLGLIK